MLIAFFVNDMHDEYPRYTTTLLAYEAARRGHADRLEPQRDA